MGARRFWIIALLLLCMTAFGCAKSEDAATEEVIEGIEEGEVPDALAENAKHPPLGIPALHQKGIIGKRVTIAVISDPLMQSHPDYADKIMDFQNFDPDLTQSSQQGPAVLSILAGNDVGAAPGIQVIYAAVPSWKKDGAYYAQAIEWILELEKQLLKKAKLRAIAVPWSPKKDGATNLTLYQDARDKAESRGIMVVDADDMFAPCSCNPENMDDVTDCKPGLPDGSGIVEPDRLLVPAAPRTVAEEKVDGEHGFLFATNGNKYWHIPYVAGVLAMGWQVNRELPFAQMKVLLLQSASEQDGYKYINPAAFVQAAKEAK